MADVNKIICPECDKETVVGEKCTNCSFPLEGYSDYERWQNALDKKRKKKAEDEAAEKKKKEDDERKKREAAQPKKKGSIFSKLGRR